MRNFLVVFASLVAAASVAHANPLSPDTAVTDAAAPIASETAPSTYVLGGVMAGGNDDLLTAGGTVEAGTRVVDHVWLHGSFTEAAADELFARGTGSLMQARVGADLM